ncbi:MAG: zinc ribbon domain-containing protein [Oscillospiraceae bacterium]|nr:zinc ribbon domain-containing protein [Oscillospiraceae bacterium]
MSVFKKSYLLTKENCDFFKGFVSGKVEIYDDQVTITKVWLEGVINKKEVPYNTTFWYRDIKKFYLFDYTSNLVRQCILCANGISPSSNFFDFPYTSKNMRTLGEILDTLTNCLNEYKERGTRIYDDTKSSVLSEGKKYCRHCGKTIEADSTFCKYCGGKQ